MTIILASKSPRRAEILEDAKIKFKIITVDTVEILNPKKSIEEAVLELAMTKAQNVYNTLDNSEDYLVLGFDTIVCFGGQAFEKPKSRQEAFAMLKKLQGSSHIVMTGCSLIGEVFQEAFVEKTVVFFNEMSDDEINHYLDNEKYLDKAGAYAIQSKFASFVKEIVGDYQNVVGLPIKRVLAKIKEYEGEN